MVFIPFLCRTLFGGLILCCSIGFAQTPTTEESLAATLAAAPTNEAREALLASQASLRNAALVKALLPHGARLQTQGKYPDALALYSFAHSIAVQINDLPNIAQTQYNVGFVHFLRNNHPAALEWLDRSRGNFQSLGDNAGLAFALNALGQVYQRQRDTRKAIATLHEALTIREQLGDQRALAVTLNLLGAMYGAEQQFEQAEPYLQRAVQIREALGDRPGMAISLSTLGSFAQGQGQLTKAVALYERAIAEFEKLGRSNAIGPSLNNLAQTHIDLGNFALAQALAEKSYQLRTELDDTLGRVTALNIWGQSLVFRGDYSRGLARFHQMLTLNERLADPAYAAIALENIANVHQLQLNLPLSLSFYEQALARYEALVRKEDMARSLHNIGMTLDRQQRREAALAPLQHGLRLAEEIRHPELQGALLTALGTTLSQHPQATQADQATALNYFQRGLQLFETSNAKPILVSTLLPIARYYSRLGQRTQALSYAERAHQLAREIGDQNHLLQALTLRGKLHQQLGQPEQARQVLTEAIATADTLRAHLAGGADDRQRHLSESYLPYEVLIETLVAEKRAAEAFHYAEQAKARTLMEVLQTGKHHITGRMTEQEQKQEQTLNAELTSLNRQWQRQKELPHPDVQTVATLEKSRQQARFAREAFVTQLYSAHPELRVQRGETKPLQLAEAASLLPNATTALLEYVVTQDQTILFVLTRRKNGATVSLQTYRIPLGREALAAKVEAFRKTIATMQTNWRTPSRQLYDLLLQPAQAPLRGKTQLVISPDGPLWDLPFQALTNATQRALLETAALSYTPSFTVLREMQKPHSAPHTQPVLLAFGNPVVGQKATALQQTSSRSAPLDPLPDAEREVKALRQLYGEAQTRIYIGADAREDRAKAEADRYAILHFATHGLIDDASPLYSRLLLAEGDTNEDGLLEAWEIMRLPLQARLAVLSACETARGQIGTGEGMIGLSWAFFIAGCPTTIASQWKVDSATTANLMLEFHRRLRPASGKAPASVAVALQQASLRLLRQGGLTRHPFFWAGFVAVGNGGATIPTQ